MPLSSLMIALSTIWIGKEKEMIISLSVAQKKQEQ